MFWHTYKPYVSVAERKDKAQRAGAKLQKKNPTLQPVVLNGSKLAESWWGQSWNHNLERYADYANRIGRGRSYVRSCAVLDLRISSGQVQGLVQGSQSSPYKVHIDIAAIPKKSWTEIKKKSVQELEALEPLLRGEFPKTLRDLFFDSQHGLFPTPAQIKFNCSCPDWASMCKHVAAVLYGVGSRLDHTPELFFTLRQADMNKLIAASVKKAVQNIVAPKKAGKNKHTLRKSTSELSALFQIDMSEDGAAPLAKPTSGQLVKRKPGRPRKKEA